MNVLAALILSLAAIPFGNPFAPPGLGQPAAPEFYDSRDEVKVSVRAQRKQVTPGQDTAIAVIFDHLEGWHVHTNSPVVPPELGSPDDYIATSLHIHVEPAGALTPMMDWIQWPDTHEVEVAFGGTPVMYGVWEGRAVAYVPVKVPADAPLGIATLQIRPVFQACNDIQCNRPTPQPPSGDNKPSKAWLDNVHEVSFDVVSPETIAAVAGAEDEPAVFNGFDPSVFGLIAAGGAAPGTSADDVTFNAFGLEFGLDTDHAGGLFLLLLVAALGGFLLNLTPCVLPVIPLKIMALSQSAHSRSRTMLLGLSMAVGVTMFWVGIGLAIALLTGFTASNQLFQYPWFTLGVGVIIAAMAVGMCGLFTVKLPDKVYMVSPKHDTLLGSFLFGIMTAVLSTPCTAPFMGAAMAWAATKSPTVTMATFAAIGIGMALPYLVLAMFPKLTDRMPKAGPASELIKQVLGGLMLAAAGYFIGVGISGMAATPPDPPSRVYFWFVAGILLITAAWLAYRTLTLTARRAPAKEMAEHTPVDMRLARHGLRWRLAGLGLSLLLSVVAIGGARALSEKGPIDWVYYLPDRFEQSLEDGNVVVLEFTAEWCLNCKALEAAVLAQPEVVNAVSQPGVVPMKVDITGNNEVGNAMLHHVGRHQIPLLVIFAPDGTEVFKGDFYTVEQVVEAIEAAKG